MKLVKIIYTATFLASCFLVSSCNDHDLPKNPVLTMPVTSVVVEVNGENYTAVPSLTEEGAISDVFTLLVKIPSANARIVDISLADGYSCNLSDGDEVVFEDFRLPIIVNQGNTEIGKYWVEMVFNPPPFFYFVKTSDRDSEGARYFLDLDAPTTIASGTYDNFFEGEVDLTASNWDNVGLVSSDLTTIYNLAAGPWPALSHYDWVAETKAAKGDGFYPTDGPWNDWLITNNNTAIVSPGVWRVIFDSSTNLVSMTMTQWAIAGNASGALVAMAYDSTTKTWHAELDLKVGSFYFETIPVTFGEPRFNLGIKTGILGQLGSDGDEIAVDEAGKYEVTLSLSNPPYYTYSLNKK